MHGICLKIYYFYYHINNQLRHDQKAAQPRSHLQQSEQLIIKKHSKFTETTSTSSVALHQKIVSKRCLCP